MTDYYDLPEEHELGYFTADGEEDWEAEESDNVIYFTNDDGHCAICGGAGIWYESDTNYEHLCPCQAE